MKTTFPYRWKAKSIENHTNVIGRFLITDGMGGYSISVTDDLMSAAHGHFGTPIRPNTLYWQCYQCRDWNHRSETTCKCGAILDKFKEGIIDG